MSGLGAEPRVETSLPGGHPVPPAGQSEKGWARESAEITEPEAPQPMRML